jgi:hypothetical protein
VKTRRLSIPLAVFVLLTCAAIAFFIFFGRDFPPSMLVNLGVGPARHMDRVKFIVLGSFASLMLPTFVTSVVGVLPRVLSSPRQGAANAKFDALLWAGLWLGCAVQIALMAMDIAIYRANLR